MVWAENNLMYFRTPDGKVTGLTLRQAKWVIEDMKREQAKGKGGNYLVDFRKYGREDGTE